MCSAREAIATTSFVGVTERANGFDGREIDAGLTPGIVLWTCSVESHDAETTRLCSLL